MLPHMFSGRSQFIWKMIFLLQWESMQGNEDSDSSVSVSNRADHGHSSRSMPCTETSPRKRRATG